MNVVASLAWRGLILPTAVAPIERVALLLQCQNEMIKQGRISVPYNGFLDCLLKVVQSGGVFSLWRGNLATILRFCLGEGYRYIVGNPLEKYVRVSREKHGTLAWIASGLAVSFVGGLPANAALHPLEYARLQLATDVADSDGDHQYAGILDVIKQTVVKDELTAMYRGFFLPFLGTIVYRAFYFLSYDLIRMLFGEHLKRNLYLSFAVGVGITVASTLAAHPVDTVRRRFMLTAGQPHKRRYKHALHALTEIQKEGVSVLWHGAGANVLLGFTRVALNTAFNQFYFSKLK